MQHRIYFSVCGEGYGHSSRDMAIAGTLSEMGADVLMGSYGYVLDRIRNDFNSVEVKREFETVGNKGAFDLKATILKSKKTALLFSKIISDEKKIIEDFDATCVVADGRSAAVISALKLGIPCVIIFNGILKIADRFPDMKFLIFTKFNSENTPENVIVSKFAQDISAYMHSAQMRELGVCETLDYDSLSLAFLFEKITLLLRDGKYRQRAKEFREMAIRMNGTKKADDIILELSGRIHHHGDGT